MKIPPNGAGPWPAGRRLKFSWLKALVCTVWVTFSVTFLLPLIKSLITDGFQSLRCLWNRLNKTLQYIMLKFLKSKNLTKKRPCKVFENLVTSLLPLIKRPIMDGFQSLRCLWKRLDKKIQYIMFEFLKSQNLTKKILFKVFENHFCQLQTPICPI